MNAAARTFIQLRLAGYAPARAAAAVCRDPQLLMELCSIALTEARLKEILQALELPTEEDDEEEDQ